MSSPLNLNQYLIDRVIFHANPMNDPEKAGKDTLNVVVEVRRRKKSRDFNIALTISINRSKKEAKKHPYSFEIGIWGNFTFANDVSEEDMLRMIQPLGTSILYGTARGYIGQLTGSAPYGCFVLPNINVYEMIKRSGNTRKSDNLSNKKKRA